jgi:peptidoglycan hydrolase FlgJ
MTLPNLTPLVDTSQLASAGNLASLKQAAAKNNPQALRAAAKQFESLFVSMVLKSMRQANFKDPLFGSDQGDLYQDMYDDQIAAQISKGKGLGLADMLVQQLRRTGAGVGDSTGTTGTTGSSGSSSSSAPGPATGAARTAGSGLPLPSSGSSARAAAATGTTANPAAAPATAAAGPATVDGSASPCPPSVQQASFAQALWPDAQRAAAQLGVSPVSLVAQAALETDWGRSVPAGAAGSSNNLFGIKATAAWNGPAVASGTHEYSNGAATAVQAQFRAYGSTSQCFHDYVALLRGNPRYAAALGTGSDVQAFGAALQQGGYATDPAYASKLAAVAGTLTRALGSGAAGPAGTGSVGAGWLKFAANLPTTGGSGALQGR